WRTERTGLPGNSGCFLKLIIIRFQFVVSDSPIFDSHIIGNLVFTIFIHSVGVNFKIRSNQRYVKPFQCTTEPPTPSPIHLFSVERTGSASSSNVLREVNVLICKSSIISPRI